MLGPQHFSPGRPARERRHLGRHPRTPRLHKQSCCCSARLGPHRIFRVHSPPEGAGCHHRPSYHARALVAACTLPREVNPKNMVRSQACRVAAALLTEVGDSRVTSEAMTLSVWCIGGDCYAKGQACIDEFEVLTSSRFWVHRARAYRDNGCSLRCLSVAC